MKYQILSKWLHERFPLSGLLIFLHHKSVPVHRYNSWYYLGNILLTCWILQIITGSVLIFHYQPTTTTAYDSIYALITTVNYGWLIRSIHKWGAHFMLAVAWIHLFSTFFLKAYRRPRELIWFTGIMLFICLMAIGFSGYLLPWSEHAFFATRVGTGIAGEIPIIGHALKIFLRGGEELGPMTLTRLFALHVVVLPLILMLIVILHLVLIQLHGLSIPPSLEKKSTDLERIPFFPEFLLRDLAISSWLTGLIVTLAVLFPPELGNKLNLMITSPEIIKPEWYFLFMFKTLQLLPAQIGSISGTKFGIIFLGLGLLLLVLAPILDRNPSAKKSMMNFIGISMVIFILVMTLLALII